MMKRDAVMVIESNKGEVKRNHIIIKAQCVIVSLCLMKWNETHKRHKTPTMPQISHLTKLARWVIWGPISTQARPKPSKKYLSSTYKPKAVMICRRLASKYVLRACICGRFAIILGLTSSRSRSNFSISRLILKISECPHVALNGTGKGGKFGCAFIFQFCSISQEKSKSTTTLRDGNCEMTKNWGHVTEIRRR